MEPVIKFKEHSLVYASLVSRRGIQTVNEETGGYRKERSHQGSIHDENDR